MDTSSNLNLKTSPPLGTRQSIRAWVLGDCGRANTNAQRVRDAYYQYVGSNSTDAILFLGDNAYEDGTDSEHQFTIFEYMYEDILKNTASWSCFGNHDGHSASSADQSGPYYDIFCFPTQGANSFDESIHTVGANGFGDGRQDGDGAYQKGLGQLEGLVHVVTGSAGGKTGDSLNHEAMFYSAAELGSCVMEVSGGELQVKFIRETGIVEDSFTVVKDVGCGLGASCDDGDICTVNDTINAQCQCEGTPISNPPLVLMLDSSDSLLHQTFKATQINHCE